MKWKKAVSALLLLCMMTTLFTFAAEQDSEELTQVILSVKERIQVPEEYSEFEYYYHKNQWNEGTYQLSWSQKKDTYRSISVGTDSEGNVLSYYQYREDETQFNENQTLSEEEAIRLAESFLYRANEKARERLFYERTENLAGSFLIRFTEKVHGIPVIGSMGTINISKASGEVLSMNLNNLYAIEKYPSAEGVIDLQKGQEAYLEKIGVEASYQLYYDWQDKSVTPFLAYTPKDYGSYAVDALTGEKIKIENGYSVYPRGMYDMAKESAMAGSGAGGLTESEQKEVSNTLNLISKEEALKKVNTYFGNGKTFTLNHAGLSRNTYDQDRYEWQLGGADGELYSNATVDAVTGTVLSFYSGQAEEEKGKTTQEEAYEQVVKILKENAGELFEHYELREEPEKEEEEFFTFAFDRVENGFKVNGNTIGATVSSHGVITSYSIQYDKKAVFTPATLTAAPEEVLKAFSKSGDFELYYYPMTSYDQKDNKHTLTVHLVYDFARQPRNLDVVTLGELDEKGKPYQENNKPVYEDLEGHWAKETIDLLAYNDFYMIKENQFLPDQQVTQGDFLTYLLKFDYIEFEDQEKLYEYALRTKLILESEIDPQGLISRKEAAKFLVRKLGMENLTKRPEIFNYPYADEIDSSYQPYVSLCYALYLLNGDTQNHFNPDQGLTRAECGVIILNLFRGTRL